MTALAQQMLQPDAAQIEALRIMAWLATAAAVYAAFDYARKRSGPGRKGKRRRRTTSSRRRSGRRR